MRALPKFFMREARASVFALGLFAGLGLSHLPMPLARYDFLLVWCLGLQVWMVRSGRERGREIAIVAAFHLLGLGLEAYKVRHGSWSYPEPALTKVWRVPLYSGFMYASVASYMLGARSELGLRVVAMPPRWTLALALGAIYANFLLARVFGDVRWPLVVGLVLLLYRVRVEFAWGEGRARMPLVLSLALIGGFVFLAENLCTALGAWVYPHQALGWRPVEAGKIVSWGLMSTVAFLALWLLGGFRRREDRPSGARASGRSRGRASGGSPLARPPARRGSRR